MAYKPILYGSPETRWNQNISNSVASPDEPIKPEYKKSSVPNNQPVTFAGSPYQQQTQPRNPNAGYALNPSGTAPAWYNQGDYNNAQTWAGGWYYKNTPGRYVPITWKPGGSKDSYYYELSDEQKERAINSGWSPEEIDFYARTGKIPYTKYPYWKYDKKTLARGVNKAYDKYRENKNKKYPGVNPRPIGRRTPPNNNGYNNYYNRYIMPLIFWHGVT